MGRWTRLNTKTTSCLCSSTNGLRSCLWVRRSPQVPVAPAPRPGGVRDLSRVGAPAGAGARQGLAGPDGRLPARLAGAEAALGGVGEKSDLTGFGINLSGLVEGGLQRYRHSKTTFQGTFAGAAEISTSTACRSRAIGWVMKRSAEHGLKR